MNAGNKRGNCRFPLRGSPVLLVLHCLCCPACVLLARAIAADGAACADRPVLVSHTCCPVVRFWHGNSGLTLCAGQPFLFWSALLLPSCAFGVAILSQACARVNLFFWLASAQGCPAVYGDSGFNRGLVKLTKTRRVKEFVVCWVTCALRAFRTVHTNSYQASSSALITIGRKLASLLQSRARAAATPSFIL